MSPVIISHLIHAYIAYLLWLMLDAGVGLRTINAVKRLILEKVGFLILMCFTANKYNASLSHVKEMSTVAML